MPELLEFPSSAITLLFSLAVYLLNDTKKRNIMRKNFKVVLHFSYYVLCFFKSRAPKLFNSLLQDKQSAATVFLTSFRFPSTWIFAKPCHSSWPIVLCFFFCRRTGRSMSTKSYAKNETMSNLISKNTNNCVKCVTLLQSLYKIPRFIRVLIV